MSNGHLANLTKNLGKKPVLSADSPAVPTAAKKTKAGKSTDPTYGAMMVYVPKKLKTDATRKWEDEHPDTPEISDMVTALLSEYLAR